MKTEEQTDFHITLGSFMFHCQSKAFELKNKIKDSASDSDEDLLELHKWETLHFKASDLWNEFQPYFDQLMDADKNQSND